MDSMLTKEESEDRKWVIINEKIEGLMDQRSLSQRTARLGIQDNKIVEVKI